MATTFSCLTAPAFPWRAAASMRLLTQYRQLRLWNHGRYLMKRWTLTLFALLLTALLLACPFWARRRQLLKTSSPLWQEAEAWASREPVSLWMNAWEDNLSGDFPAGLCPCGGRLPKRRAPGGHLPGGLGSVLSRGRGSGAGRIHGTGQDSRLGFLPLCRYRLALCVLSHPTARGRSASPGDCLPG